MNSAKIQFTELQFEQLIEVSEYFSFPKSIVERLKRYLVKGESIKTLTLNFDKETFESYLAQIREAYKDAMQYTVKPTLSKACMTEEQCQIIMDSIMMPLSLQSDFISYYVKGNYVDFNQNWLNWSECFLEAHNDIIKLRELCKDDPQHQRYYLS